MGPIFVERGYVKERLPGRPEESHKGTFGKVLVVGGCVGYSGAPYLAASSAERSGCGLVFLGVPEGIWAVEAGRCVGVMPFPLPEKQGMLSEDALQDILDRASSCDVLALGPGLGRSTETARLVRRILRRTDAPVVLDADGINALEGHPDVLESRRGRVTVLTPHDGEYARIAGTAPGEDRAAEAAAFAAAHGCVLVLKGHRSVTASPDGAVRINTTGNSGLAKGGSGDVLTGIIASLIAQGMEPAEAAACGAWIHGRAGDLAAERLTAYAMTPADVISALPEVFSELV